MVPFSIIESVELLESNIADELEKILGDPPVCRNMTVLAGPICLFFTYSVKPAIAFPV